MSECIDRFLNGIKLCHELVPDTIDQYMCDAEWCPYHPNYKKSEVKDKKKD